MPKGEFRLRRPRNQSLLFITGTLFLDVALWAQKIWLWPPWFSTLLTLIVTMGGTTLAWARERAELTDRRDKTLHNSSIIPVKAGQLSSVRDISDAEAGVNRAIVHVSYQVRDCEAKVSELLLAGRPVLVFGPSLAGKTRMALEVLRRRFAQWPIWLPDSVEGITAVMAGRPPQNTVVWLNELDRFLTQDDQFKVRWLSEWARSGCVVVATMRNAAREGFQPTSDRKNPAADVISRFDAVELGHSDLEQSRLADSVASEGISSSTVRKYGLGAYLGGGVLARERFESGRSEHPNGVRLLRIAADWHRCGLRTIPAPTLRDLSEHYPLAAESIGVAEGWDAAIRWAREPFGAGISLLMEEEDGLRLFDYLLERFEDEGLEIPEVTRSRVVADAPPELLLLVALSLEENGHYAEADAALHRAIVGGDEHTAAWATIALGYRAESTDADGAADLYQQAINTGHADAMPWAMLALGLLYERAGKNETAADLYQQAINTGDEDAAAVATYKVGRSRERAGDFVAAAELYQQAINTGHADAMPLATLRLGFLRQQAGDAESAADLYQQAINTGHADAMPWATLRLGFLRQQAGDAESAADLYQQAINTGHAGAARCAMLTLGLLREWAGDPETASDLYQQAANTGDKDAAELVQRLLGER